MTGLLGDKLSSMEIFSILTPDGKRLRFQYYKEQSPNTCRAFEDLLPFSRRFFHARVSGFEIWIDDAPRVDVAQENASVFAEPGEIVIAPVYPSRNRIKGCMGIFYGEGKLVDAGNIFARVVEEDLALLKELGDSIWRNGAQLLQFEKI